MEEAAAEESNEAESSEEIVQGESKDNFEIFVTDCNWVLEIGVLYFEKSSKKPIILGRN